MAGPVTQGGSRRLGDRLVRALSAAAPDSPGAAVEAVLREVATALDAQLATLWTLDEATGHLRWQQDWSPSPALDDFRLICRRLTFAPGVGVPGRSLETLEPVVMEDLQPESLPRAAAALRAGLHSIAAAPLLVPEGRIGVLELFSEAPHGPTGAELDDLVTAARQLAAFVGRLRIEDRLRAAEETSASIVAAALDCIITMDHDGKVIDFNPAAEATFGYARDAAVGRQLGELIIPPELREAHAQALGRYLEQRTPTILDRRLELVGMRADGSIFPVELTVTRLGTREPPVFAGFIRDISERRRHEREQARVLEEAERALDEAERARGRLAFLAHAARTMAESMDWEATLRAVVSSPVPALADRCILTLAGHDNDEVARYPEEADAEGADPPGHDVTVALDTRGGVIGTLAFHRKRAFDTDDLELIASFASRAALHLHNARLYTERSHIAQTLQASLRPRALPEIPGAVIAARYLPAGDHNEVGGDFYDVFRSGDGVWTAVVGDVSGKGPEAAAVTALARHTLRAASMVHDDPATNLALLNRAMHDDSAMRDFCTVLHARLCPSGRGIDVRFANGGHPSPLLLRSDGTVEEVATGRGPLVGVLRDAHYEEARLRLEAGELLLLYTDGVTEIRTTDVDLGERELRATLAANANAGASADEVVDAVARRAVELQAGVPRDDIALVAVKVNR